MNYNPVSVSHCCNGPFAAEVSVLLHRATFALGLDLEEAIGGYRAEAAGGAHPGVAPTSTRGAGRSVMTHINCHGSWNPAPNFRT